MTSSRKFCCCLPVRIGVFILSGLTAVFSVLSAAAIWYTIARASRDGLADKSSANIDLNNASETWRDSLDSIRLDRTQYIAFIIAGALLTLLGLFSIFGFIGSVARKRNFVAIYASAMWWFLGIEIAAGAFFMYAIFKDRKDIAQDCTEQTQEEGACKTATKFVIGIYVASFVVQWLIHLYCCLIVRRYVQQLDDEQGYHHRPGGNKVNHNAGTAGSYYAHQPLAKNEHEMPSYPYAAPDHSFGAHK